MLLLALAAGGCTVGPDFRAPDPPAVAQYTAGAPVAGPLVPQLVAGRDLPAEWWAIFGSVELDALVRDALAANPTLAAARARLVQAQELLAARTGATDYPQVDAAAGAVRQRIDPATFGFPQAPNPGPFNVFDIGVNVSYAFDFFGGNRRALEGLAAEVDYQGYELEAARLTVATNVVVAVIRQAGAAAQIEAVTAILDAQRRQFAITNARFQAGGVAWLDVQSQGVLVAQTAALLPPLQAQYAQAGHLRSVLAGEAPAAAIGAPLRLADLHLPAELPLRLPSELARRRPDIRASEALLHRASADVGVATADLYPKLVITGGFSSAQLSASQVFGNGINLWNIGINLVQPLFRGGELQARKRAAEAAYTQAGAAYRLAVLQGLQNVADVLRALEADGATLAARSEQAARAAEAAQIAAGRFEAGGISQWALLDAERARLQAEVERIQVLTNRLADAAGLFQALGGGWEAAGATAAPPPR